MEEEPLPCFVIGRVALADAGAESRAGRKPIRAVPGSDTHYFRNAGSDRLEIPAVRDLGKCAGGFIIERREGL